MSDSKDEMKKKDSSIGTMKASFSGRKFRSGAYATLLSMIVIIIALVINLLATELNFKADLSAENLYTISAVTKYYLKDVKDNVTIYYLAETGKEDQVFYKIANQYSNFNSKVKVVSKDHVLYPKFASQFVDNEVKPNSILVVNEDTGRAKYIDFSEMLIQELNYQTFQNETIGIDVEGKVTSAIQFVTEANLPMIYEVEGHGENPLGNEMKSILDRQNMSLQTLATLTADRIPQDCDLLLINAPERDYTENEIDILKNYMSAGGKVIVSVDYKARELPNFHGFLNYYGIGIVEGVIFEGDAKHYLPNYPHYIVPNVQDHELNSSIKESKQYILAPIASGLSVFDNNRSSIKIEPLLTTSKSAYSKIDLNASSVSKEAGDIEGPFYLGVYATDTYNDITSKMIVVTSEVFFNDNTIKTFANAELLTNAVNRFTGKTSTLSIRKKSLKQERLTITQGTVILWGAIVVIIIPVIILAVGVIVSLKRRKR